MSDHRILIVDDFEGFRRFTSSILQQRQGFQIVGEAADGLEALEKARELQPHLILLDIGLPHLNGIDVARRVRELVPAAKILFLSVDSDPDLVREALRLGAGYVHKLRAQIDLLPAIEAVFRGGQFVSPDLEISGGTDDHRHEAGFYTDDASFLEDFTQFIVGALRAGNAVIVVATEPHREDLLPRLQTHGLDMAGAIEEGRYISLDADSTLSTFMVNDLPDRTRFVQAVSDLVTLAAKAVQGDHRRVAACGECAPLLWAQGNAEAAILLERFWDEIARGHGIQILCGYSLDSFRAGSGSHVFEKICAEHSEFHSC